MRFIFIILFLLLQPAVHVKSFKAKNDSTILAQLFKELENNAEKEIGLLITDIGTAFIETPYVAHTLENGVKEELVVNLREFDCTTFAENSLAIARAIKMGKANWNGFSSELEKIRYRKGNRDGYCSRLHYFSEWIADNVKKGIVIIPKELQIKPFEKAINFMSQHPNSYEVLKENPELVDVIRKQEVELSANNIWYIPKSGICKSEKFLKDGDIVGITTSIKGLDIAHVGIIITVAGRKHLMHASTSAMQVVVSESTLPEFISAKKSYTGIIIARPVEVQ